LKKLFILFLTVILCASTIIGCAPSANTSLTTIPASTTGTSNWTIQKIPDSVRAKLWGIWGSSSTDVFVGGNLGTLLHYNGKTWSSMTTNVPASWTTDIWGTAIWGSSSTDVFVVGIGVGILHYAGNK
jgi:hypothetical protein